MAIVSESTKQILENETKDKLDGKVPPVLIVPNHEKTNSKDQWIVYKIADDKLLRSNLIPPPQDWVFDGSSEGWLVTVTRRYELILYKPFDENKRVLRLPSLILGDDRPEQLALERKCWLLKFVTVTADPIGNPTDLICLAIFGMKRELACIRPGIDNKWTRVKPSEPFDREITDVVHHNNQFYATTASGMLVLVDGIGTSEPSLKEILSAPRPFEDEYEYEYEPDYLLYKEYLVESCERELLFIQRFIGAESSKKCIYVTTKFVVWKLSYDNATPTWEKLKSLGQCALFLGVNNSISVLASSGNHGCQKNCIYFTQDKDTRYYFHEHSDMGVYNLETKTFKRGFGIDESTFANLRHGRFLIFVQG